MDSAEVSLTRQQTSKYEKKVTIEEANSIIGELSVKFNMDIMELVKKVAHKQADGISLNINNPYTHLFISNGSENISIELKTLENETKIKVPKSLFV